MVGFVVGGFALLCGFTFIVSLIGIRVFFILKCFGFRRVRESF